MTAKYDGGPAYPVPTRGEHDAPDSGMSLRDYFAGMFMQGLVSVSDIDMTKAQIARSAYKMADSMLAERNNE